MERKDFIKNGLGFVGMAIAIPSLLRGVGPAGSDETLVCTATNSETAGPFPTHTPASYVISDIRADRTGIDLTVNITINNTNANCTAYQGAIVDIWHCDKDGYYSEYGGTGMQPQDFTAYHFLRGRQTTNANGVVSFTTIFPGWYSGRATHIHVHIYNASGSSLLVTQIAFPEGTNSAVVQVNASAENGYTKGMTGYTYNASDNVFSDGVTNELSSVAGSVAEGYSLSHTIYVNGPTLGIDEITASQNMIGQNYPNPFTDKTTIPLNLALPSRVSAVMYDLHGRTIGTVAEENFAAGNHGIVIERSVFDLSSGYYICKVKVENANGVFEENKKILVQ